MPEILRARGVYRNGAIALDRPIPELEDMDLDVSVVFPEGHAHAVAVQVEARYSGILLELGRSLGPLGHGQDAPIVGRIRDFRQRLLDRCGFRLPPVRILVRDSLGANRYAISMRSRVVAEAEIQPSRILAVVADPNDEGLLRQFGVELQPDPIFGLPSCWIRSGLEERAKSLGMTVADPAAVIASHLQEMLTRQLGDCVERDAALTLIANARGIVPELVSRLIPSRISEARLHVLMRMLLNLKRDIRPVQAIFEAVDEFPGEDDEALAAFVASRLPEFAAL